MRQSKAACHNHLRKTKLLFFIFEALHSPARCYIEPIKVSKFCRFIGFCQAVHECRGQVNSMIFRRFSILTWTLPSPRPHYYGRQMRFGSRGPRLEAELLEAGELSITFPRWWKMSSSHGEYRGASIFILCKKVVWPFFFIYLIKLIWTLFHLKNYCRLSKTASQKNYLIKNRKIS